MLVTFLVAMRKYWAKHNLKDEGFTLANGWWLQPIIMVTALNMNGSAWS